MTAVTIQLPDELVRELRRLAEARRSEPAVVAAEMLGDALRRRELAGADLDALFEKLKTRQQADPEPLSDDEAMEIALAEQRAYRAEQRAVRAGQDAPRQAGFG